MIRRAIVAVLIMSLLVILPGCPAPINAPPGQLQPPTPRQAYALAATTYDLAVTAVALDSKLASNPDVAKAEQAVAQQLNAAAAYIAANPATADTPGAPLPPLDPLNVALATLQKFVPVVPVTVPVSVPATAPATATATSPAGG